MKKIDLFSKNSNLNILLAGIVSLFIALGVARFSYTSLLPAMLEDKAISLAFSGVMASVNYVGYLLGALFAIFIKSMSIRSEEHTSELQSRRNLVCRLLLEKKNNNKNIQ